MESRFNKVAELQPATLLTKRLRHKCFTFIERNFLE